MLTLEAEGHLHVRRLVQVGKCIIDPKQVTGPTGASRHVIDRGTQRMLTRFFAPFNEDLFALLGRKLEYWDDATEQHQVSTAPKTT